VTNEQFLRELADIVLELVKSTGRPDLWSRLEQALATLEIKK